MKTKLDDGRIFETIPFLEINFNDAERVYKFEFITKERRVKSSSQHRWLVWDKEIASIYLERMNKIDINKHELIVQGW